MMGGELPDSNVNDVEDLKRNGILEESFVRDEIEMDGRRRSRNIAYYSINEEYRDEIEEFMEEMKGCR